jgi:hypothetical protein
MAKRNQLSRGGPAGGPGSRSLTPKVTTYFGGQPSNNTSPRGVSQIGSSMGNHVGGIEGGGKTVRGAVEPMYSGKVAGVGSTKLGNEVALNVGGGGPGAGRTVMRTGSQHGLASSPAPIGPTKDTLAEFGPDSPNAKDRR